MVAPKIHPYKGMSVSLATMHGKEHAIAGPMADILGLNIQTALEIDTDQFGTFTGETPRPGDMRQTALLKAREGIRLTRLSAGLASEGSFGPHPFLPFVGVGRELLVFVDDARGLVVSETLLNIETNFSHVRVRSADGVEDFLTSIGFPDHAVVVTTNDKTSPETVGKGLRSIPDVRRCIFECVAASSDGFALVQTDMRANFNPTRMKMIGQLAQKLGERLQCICPACSTPGFGFMLFREGLPCARCFGATSETLNEIWGCSSCTYRENRDRADGLCHSDPGDCAHCNP